MIQNLMQVPVGSLEFYLILPDTTETKDLQIAFLTLISETVNHFRLGILSSIHSPSRRMMEK